MSKFNVINGLVSVTGFATTIALVVHETPGYLKEKDELKDKSFSTVGKCVLKHYYPAIITGTVTVGSIICGAVINDRTQASLIAAAGSGYGLYKRYGDEVKKKLGLDTHKSILKSLADGDIGKKKIDIPEGYKLYWNDIIGHFIAKPENFEKARYEINRKLCGQDKWEMPCYFISVQDFLDLCKATKYEPNEAFKYVGWDPEVLWDNVEALDEPQWIKVEASDIERKGIDGTPYTMITFKTALSNGTEVPDDANLMDDVINILEKDAIVRDGEEELNIRGPRDE